MKLNVKVEGIQSLIERFKMLENIDKKDVKNEVLSSASEILIQGLEEASPRDKGNLSGSVQEVSRTGNSVSVSFEGAGTDGRLTEIYGYYQHFGSCRNNATRWVSKGYLACKEEVIETIIQILKARLGE